MADIFDATVAGDALMGGETRLDMYSAIVDGNAGNGGVVNTDLEKIENFSHAFWYIFVVAGASDDANNCDAPLTRVANLAGSAQGPCRARGPMSALSPPDNETEDQQWYCVCRECVLP